MWIETPIDPCPAPPVRQFIRQQWRMWIETLLPMSSGAAHAEFIRQQWRMWIETDVRGFVAIACQNSFASNGECGLKLRLLRPSGGFCS